MKKIVLAIISITIMFTSANIVFADSHGFEEYDVAFKYLADNEYPLAVKYFKLAAQKGNVKAMKMLGTIYQKGIITPKNHTEAFKWYKKAADLGSTEALVELGYCYEFGMGTPQNEKLAFQCMKKASDNNIKEAYYFVGMAYARGKVVQKAPQLAIKWITKSYEAYAKDKYKKENASYAANELGEIYYYGDGVKEDIPKAMQWYKKAVDLNYFMPFPSYRLGEFYFEREDYEEAFKYYKISSTKADGHFIPALVAMGDMYSLACGVAKDYLIAVEYYKKATELYSPTAIGKQDAIGAMYRLGRLYMIGGYSLEQNIDTAKIWLRKAANLGDIDAKKALVTIE